ncbi:hypothetical protein FACS1894191_8750 [Clostridia bacterium]|nr:hypothetical protein FACS1894191_8750 [Clostridia bacterium]
MLTLKLQRQELVRDSGSFCSWQAVHTTALLEPEKTALIIVDMWDQHWSKGATHRCGALAEEINEAAGRARKNGILVVHAPSDTMAFYAGHPARERFLSRGAQTPSFALAAEPAIVEIPDHPMPLDVSDGGSDTVDDHKPNTGVWSRQTEKIDIDAEHDILCGDEGDLLFSCLCQSGIHNLLYAGVHTNMCIIGRTFGIKAMLKRGIRPILVRDLTDSMCNPSRPPYVSHEEGTRLVIGYIEKFYCPTITSDQI